MSARIRLKRGSTTSWANSSKDNKLSYGQPGIEIRAGKAPRLKVGNQASDTAWASIPYAAPDPEIYKDDKISFEKFTIAQNTDGFYIKMSDNLAPDLICDLVKDGSSHELRFCPSLSTDCTIGMNTSGIVVPLKRMYSKDIYISVDEDNYRIPVVRYGSTLPTDFTGHKTGDIFYLLQE